MQRRHGLVFVGLVFVAAALALVLTTPWGPSVQAQASPQGFGNTEAALVRMADVQPRLFVKAVKETVVEVVPQNLQSSFRDTLKAKLGLGGFSADVPSETVYKLRALKQLLDDAAQNSDALFDAILRDIQPFDEGESEGEGA